MVNRYALPSALAFILSRDGVDFFQLHRIWNHLRNGLLGTPVGDSLDCANWRGKAHPNGRQGHTPRRTSGLPQVEKPTWAFAALDALHLNCELKIQNEQGLRVTMSLRALATLPEDWSLTPSTHMKIHNHLEQRPLACRVATNKWYADYIQQNAK